MKVLLHEMSWVEAKEYFEKNDIALLPVGSNEQHGPQNPLGTDHLIAKALAEETAKRTGVVCLPVIPFGVSSHHKQFWGTIHVSPKALKEYVKEVCLALNYYGVKKIVIVNGHGGNLNALAELSRELRESGMLTSLKNLKSKIWCRNLKFKLTFLFPLNCCWRLMSYIINNSADFCYFISYSS